jgi:hypothetical protein
MGSVQFAAYCTQTFCIWKAQGRERGDKRLTREGAGSGRTDTEPTREGAVSASIQRSRLTIYRYTRLAAGSG